MRLTTILAALFITLCSISTFSFAAQDDQIRGGWLESRGRTQKRNKPSASTRTTKSQPSQKTPDDPQQPAATEQTAGSGLGIGYTLFKKASNGEFVRVSTEDVFKSGDSVRLLVETNMDGYLYIFSRESGQSPMLLYPNAQVQNGNNYVKAHQAFWLPEEGEIEFEGNPAKETLTLVFSERPLPNFSPSASLEGTPVDIKLYDEIARETEVNRIGNLNVGLRLTTEEGTRKVRIRKTAPSPAYILVNRDAKSPRIVANIQLMHN